MTTNTEKIDSLRKQIAELKQHWPAHSLPPALMEQLDDLEEALEKALRNNDETVDEDHADADPH
jgi:hypothetical protein